MKTPISFETIIAGLLFILFFAFWFVIFRYMLEIEPVREWILETLNNH